MKAGRPPAGREARAGWGLGSGGTVRWRLAAAGLAGALLLSVAAGAPAGATPVSGGSDGAATTGGGAAVAAAGVSAAPPGEAARPQCRRHAVVVLVEGLDWAALKDPSLPWLGFWLGRGAVGAMNAATAGHGQPGDACVTLGAGSRAEGGELAGLGYEAGEDVGGGSAGDLYAARAGRPPRGRLVHLGVWGIREANAGSRHLVRVGALGGTLSRAGVRRAVLGNSDLPGCRRLAVALAMDEEGQVDEGMVGAGALVRDPAAPGGVRTDWARLAREVDRLWPDVGFMVLEAGDLARLAAAAELYSPSRRAELRAGALAGLDGFLGFLASRTDPARDLLVLLSPAAAVPDSERGMGLAPILAAGPGLRPGVLTSSTTRRRALVANIDLLPTVAGFLGAGVPGEVYGAPLRWTRSPRPLQEAARLASRALVTHRQRPSLVRGYVGLAMACLGLAALTATWRPEWGWWVRWLLLCMMAAPVAFLFLPLVQPAALAAAALVAALLSGAAAALCRVLGRRHPLGPLVWLGLITVGSLAVDQGLGAPLELHSPLGYSPISGARFYGLGNEFLGVVCGAAITAFCAALDRWPGRRRLIRGLGTAALAGLALGLGWPRLGANAGAALTSVVAFGLVAWQAGGGRVGGRAVLAAVGGGVGVLALLTLADLALAWLRPVGTAGGVLVDAGLSHMGRTALLLARFGPGTLADVAVRKLDLNLRLILYTVWSRALLACLGTLALLLNRPAGAFARLCRLYPSLALGLKGTLVAAAVALAVNDSGVVAAATTMIYPPAVLAYLCLAPARPQNRPPEP